MTKSIFSRLFLIFKKWTKINVQNRLVKKGLTEKIFCYDMDFLWSQTNP